MFDPDHILGLRKKGRADRELGEGRRPRPCGKKNGVDRAQGTSAVVRMKGLGASQLSWGSHGEELQACASAWKGGEAPARKPCISGRRQEVFARPKAVAEVSSGLSTWKDGKKTYFEKKRRMIGEAITKGVEEVRYFSRQVAKGWVCPKKLGRTPTPKTGVPAKKLQFWGGACSKECSKKKLAALEEAEKEDSEEDSRSRSSSRRRTLRRLNGDCGKGRIHHLQKKKWGTRRLNVEWGREVPNDTTLTFKYERVHWAGKGSHLLCRAGS